MNEIINEFLSKNCYITVSGYSQLKGIITKVKDNWMIVETKNGDEIVNLDYVASIKEIKK